MRALLLLRNQHSQDGQTKPVFSNVKATQEQCNWYWSQALGQKCKGQVNA